MKVRSVPEGGGGGMAGLDRGEVNLCFDIVSFGDGSWFASAFYILLDARYDDPPVMSRWIDFPFWWSMRMSISRTFRRYRPANAQNGYHMRNISKKALAS